MLLYVVNSTSGEVVVSMAKDVAEDVGKEVY